MRGVFNRKNATKTKNNESEVEKDATTETAQAQELKKEVSDDNNNTNNNNNKAVDDNIENGLKVSSNDDQIDDNNKSIELDEDRIAEDDAILESMDIDNDYDVWTSIKASKSNAASQEALVSDRNEKELVNRSEIYSNFYKPNAEEQKNIKSLAEKLGFSAGMWKFQNKNEETPILFLLDLINDESGAKSIVLKQSTLCCNDEERVIILLTHGIILAKPEEKGLKLFAGRRFVDAKNLKDVTCIMDHNCIYEDEEDCNPAGLTIKFSDEKQWMLMCRNEFDKNQWLYALNKSIIPTLTRSLDSEKRIKGWQHSVLQNSLFSAAVIGNDKMLEHLHSLYPKNINDIDEYGCTALHYSIMYDHIDCIKFLLDNFADFMIKTSSGTTVVELADGQESKTLLEEYKINSRTVPSNQSILFEQAKKAAAQDQPSQEEAKVDNVVSKINSATKNASSTMSEAMTNLMKRGEKLVKLETQTGQLKDDAEEYKDMASELKNQMKKKNNRFGF